MQSNQCITCKHYLGTNHNDKPVCSAYTAGIPYTIMTGVRDHRKPLGGDNGIRWEKRKLRDVKR